MSQRAKLFQNNWKIIAVSGLLLVPEVNVVFVEGVTLHVEWAPVIGASHYTLIVREDTKSRPSKIVLTVEGEVSDVPNLKPATRYCVTLSAKSSTTQSAYSTPVCITSGIPIWITTTFMSGREKQYGHQLIPAIRRFAVVSYFWVM